MKKFTLLLAVALTTIFSGCYKSDIDALKDDVKDLKEQMAKYEALLNAMNDRLYVTGYEQSGNKYTLTLSDSTVLVIGDSPAFVTRGENGHWYIDNKDTQVATEGFYPALSRGANGNWFIGDTDTGITALLPATDYSIMAIVRVDERMTFVFGDGRTVALKSMSPEINITIPAGGFNFDMMKWMKITPAINYGDNASFVWTSGSDTLSTAKDLMHVFLTPGNYTLRLTVSNGIGSSFKDVNVKIAEKTYTNGVAKVFEFLPAPGQFVNNMPAWVEGDDAEAMRVKAENALLDNSLIHLGSFGGYVVMGFDHTIVNVSGQANFVVNGNAFSNWAEPGVIMVSYDANQNGLPDDEWYEIKGSGHDDPHTIANYEITYYKPDPNKAPTPDPDYAYITDTTYIKWKDNQGQTGYVYKNSFHGQSYYPGWAADSITFKGTRLSGDKVYDQSGSGSFYVSIPFDYGYADNWPNADEKAKIHIDWAIDKDGNPVKLKGIDFIKVYAGQLAQAGWLGEVSTEITGVKDLNL